MNTVSVSFLTIDFVIFKYNVRQNIYLNKPTKQHF